MFNFFENNAGRKTVAGVMQAFHNAIEDLNQVEREHSNEAQRKHDEAARLHQEAMIAEREAAYASEVRSKLNNIVAEPNSFDSVALAVGA